MDKPLKTILLDYINAQEGWVSKGSMYLIAEQHEYSPENAGRRLRELANEGRISVEHYKGKRNQTLTKYAKIGTEKPQIPKATVTIRMVDGIPMASISMPHTITGTGT